MAIYHARFISIVPVESDQEQPGLIGGDLDLEGQCGLSKENATDMTRKRKSPTRKPSVSAHADLKRALRFDRTIGDPVSTAIVALADKDFRSDFLVMLEKRIMECETERRYFTTACGRVSNYTATKSDRFLDAVRGYLSALNNRPPVESRERMIAAISMFVHVWVNGADPA